MVDCCSAKNSIHKPVPVFFSRGERVKPRLHRQSGKITQIEFDIANMDLYFNYYYQRKASAIWIVAVEANFFFYFPAGENSEPEIQNSGHCLDVKGLGGLSAVKKAGPI